jgi:hypothetical protein
VLKVENPVAAPLPFRKYDRAALPGFFQGATIMSERYQIFDQDSPVDSQQLAAFLAKDGQLLLPMVELIEQAQRAVDEVIDVMGRATVEAILQMSAQQLAGPKQQGKAADREVALYRNSTGTDNARDKSP